MFKSMSVIDRKGKPDADGYRDSDSGCRIATEFKGAQSACLECPFPTCKLDKRKPKIDKDKT